MTPLGLVLSEEPPVTGRRHLKRACVQRPGLVRYAVTISVRVRVLPSIRPVYRTIFTSSKFSEFTP
jgi:hypothetical protein